MDSDSFLLSEDEMYYSFETCIKPSSSGVLRPKILTITFSFLRSSLIFNDTAKTIEWPVNNGNRFTNDKRYTQLITLFCQFVNLS